MTSNVSSSMLIGHQPFLETTISSISNNMITLSQSHHFENDQESKLEFYHKDIIIDISQGW